MCKCTTSSAYALDTESELSLDRVGSSNSYEVPEEKEIHVSEVVLPFVPYESSDDDISMRSVALHKTSANHTHQTSQTVSTPTSQSQKPIKMSALKMPVVHYVSSGDEVGEDKAKGSVFIDLTQQSISSQVHEDELDSKHGDVSHTFSPRLSSQTETPSKFKGVRCALHHSRRRRVNNDNESSAYAQRSSAKSALSSDSDSNDSEQGTTYELAPDLKGVLPSLSTLRRTRYMGMGAHVEKRVHHHHARCTTCMVLQQQIQRGFQMRVSVEFWDKQMVDHNGETRFWRDLEMRLFYMSRYNPARVIVITFDDTSVFGLPHFTNRPPKHLPSSTVNFVPFNITNHGMMENFYIYSEKSIHKGGNRICTYLYHMLHRIKHKKSAPGSVQNMQCNARKLVLMADNFIEKQV